MRKKTKRLLEENNQAEAALNEQGKKLLTDIVVYLRGSRITTWEQEQVRRDITQMLLDAQARGEQAEAVNSATAFLRSCRQCPIGRVHCAPSGMACWQRPFSRPSGSPLAFWKDCWAWEAGRN